MMGMADETENQETAEEQVTDAVADVAADEPAAEAEAEAPAADEPAAEAEAPAADAPAEEPAAEAEAPAAAEKPKRAPRKKKVDEEAAAEAPAEPSARVPRSRKKATTPAPKKTAKKAAERGAYVRTPAGDAAQGRRRERRGVVVSDKGDKTITVRVDVLVSHPKYKKIIRRSVKLRAHDAENQAHIGDVVRLIETRPVSRTKRWRLVEIVEAAR